MTWFSFSTLFKVRTLFQVRTLNCGQPWRAWPIIGCVFINMIKLNKWHLFMGGRYMSSADTWNNHRAFYIYAICWYEYDMWKHSPFWSPPSASGAHDRHGLIGRELWNHYISAEKCIKSTQFWHIFIIKVSRNCDLASWNERFLTNQFSILDNWAKSGCLKFRFVCASVLHWAISILQQCWERMFCLVKTLPLQ